jgi:hypothetical protein
MECKIMKKEEDWADQYARKMGQIGLAIMLVAVAVAVVVALIGVVE